jgi:NitT/TauT family transport system ATP-binding protein
MVSEMASRVGSPSTGASAGIELRNVSLTFQRGESSLEVLRDISLTVQPGEFVCIVGPSGSGKTTLLRLLDGLLAPTSGEILIGGKAVRGPGPDRGFVFQSDRLLPWRTVLDNIAFSLEARGVGKKQARDRAHELVRVTGLDGFEGHYPFEISGGMRQRVNLARALAPEPAILLMDEPFAALDAQTREVMQLELTTIWSKDRRTVVFVTHQLDEAVYLADRVVVLGSRPGRLREVVVVDVPRPRTLETKRGPRFVELVDQMWLMIRDQVLQERRV